MKFLIACYAEYKHCFEKGKSTKKIILEQIASTFKSDDVKVSGEQCMIIITLLGMIGKL